MLAFQEEALQSVLDGDALLVLGRGLGLHALVLSLVKIYAASRDVRGVVLLLNVIADEQELLREECEQGAGAGTLSSVNMQTPAQSRQVLYTQEGCLIVTAPILIVDLLNKRLLPKNIAGIIVNDAHRVSESSKEAFILRLFRQGNREGFVKAFSDQPDQFQGGFHRAEAIMRALFVRRLSLWPRFHVTVSESFEQHEPDVVELRVPMTATMIAIQKAVLEAMSACLEELKSAHRGDLSQLSIEDGLSKALDRSIMAQLQPIWHRVGAKTKQLVKDLETLRKLLEYMVRYDCVTFMRFLEVLQHSEGPQCIWLGLASTDRIFKLACSRLYRFKHSRSKAAARGGRAKRARGAGEAAQNATAAAAAAAAEDDRVELNVTLEPNPKWHNLLDILGEIELAQASIKVRHPVLVMARDDRTCDQLAKFLSYHSQRASAAGGSAQNSEQSFLKGQLCKYVYHKAENQNWDRSAVVHQPEQPTNQVTLTQMQAATGSPAVNPSPQQAAAATAAETKARREHKQRALLLATARQYRSAAAAAQPPQEVSAGFGVLSSPTVVVRPISKNWRGARLLQELQPNFVVMYDPDNAFVRLLEVFKANNPGLQLRVYFMTYDNSVEQQKYLSAMRREKEAFEMLIRDKATMVLPDWKSADHSVGVSTSAIPSGPRSQSRSGGQGGSATLLTTQKVIIDTREFRSSLPSTLHKRGMVLFPVTLEVGDYILTPSICVERKSLSDLIGSFASGRLYTQADSMCRYYKTPVLLIEFTEGQPFALPSINHGEVSLNAIQSKVATLAIHFPRLRILWTKNAFDTAAIFADLKANEPQPDPVRAAALGTSDGDGEFKESGYSVVAEELLRHLPGITSSNCHAVMRSVTCVADLAKMSEAALRPLLGKVGAEALHKFLGA